MPSMYPQLLVPPPNLFSPYGLACLLPWLRNACSLGRGSGRERGGGGGWRCGKVGIQGAERREGPAANAPVREWDPPQLPFHSEALPIRAALGWEEGAPGIVLFLT